MRLMEQTLHWFVTFQTKNKFKPHVAMVVVSEL